MTAHRVQLSRAKSWKMPPNTVKVDRTTRWGNPFFKHGDGAPMDRALAVHLFEKMLAEHGGFMAKLRGHGMVSTDVSDIKRDLPGKNLACWCPLDGPCHADVLLRVANEGASK